MKCEDWHPDETLGVHEYLPLPPYDWVIQTGISGWCERCGRVWADLSHRVGWYYPKGRIF